MKVFSTELKYALFLTLGSILWAGIERMLGWHGELIGKHQVYTLGFLVIVLIIYILSIREKRDTFYEGNMIWAEGLKSGLILTIIASILSVPAQWFIHSVISPDYFENAIEYATEFNNMSCDSAEENFSLGTYMVLAPIGTFLFGFIISAIVSAIVKRG